MGGMSFFRGRDRHMESRTEREGDRERAVLPEGGGSGSKEACLFSEEIAEDCQ